MRKLPVRNAVTPTASRRFCQRLVARLNAVSCVVTAVLVIIPRERERQRLQLRVKMSVIVIQTPSLVIVGQRPTTVRSAPIKDQYAISFA